jgi:malonyl-CoA/methylmalonyl-CoA synthetase
LADDQGSGAALARRADDPALLVFTSGTTGSPKGVPLSHGNLHSNLTALQRVWDWSERDRLLHVLPVFHLHGLGVALYGSLLAGSAVVLHERFDPERVLAEAGPAQISLLMAVPTLLHRLLEASQRESDARLAGLRAVISGSAPLAPALFERFRERFGLEPVERYGMSETLMNASNPVHGVRKPGSVGPAVPGVEIRLREPVEGSGEVEVRGPNVFGGYWNDAEATSAAFDGEWFRTGDLGRFDDDGFLRLVGRAKEIIVTGGYNVSPLAVERALEECRGVVELAVAALPDRDLGERVTAFVVARTGMALDDLEARLRARAEAELPRYAWPREYRFCESLPRNALGKLERARLGDRQILRD